MAVEKPWVTNRAVPIAASTAPMPTALVAPFSSASTPWTRLLTPRSLCANPR